MHENLDYSAFVKRLAKPGAEILATLTPEKVDLWHMATGVSTEAGELLDAVKKHVIYNKDIDVENIIEEIGDELFYLYGMMNSLKLTLAQTIEANKVKLMERYKKGYSDKAAQDREDKAEKPIAKKSIKS